MTWHAASSGKRGAQPIHGEAAIQPCLTIKVLFGPPLRRTTGFVASLLRLVGLDRSVPDHSTPCRRQRTLAVRLPYRGSIGPRHRLIDSTGIEVRGEGEWHARKHGGAKRRVWRKVRLALDEGEADQDTVRGTVSPANLDVRAEEIAGSGVGDAPMRPNLLSQIPEGETTASATADGARDGRACRDGIARREAVAIIPPRRNAKPWSTNSPGAPARNEALRAIKRRGRTLRRRWSGHHRRSRVEAETNCVKLLGQRPAARDLDRQTAELQVRIAILDRFTALGIPSRSP